MDSLKKNGGCIFFLKTYVHSNFFRVDERSEGSYLGLDVFFPACYVFFVVFFAVNIETKGYK